VNPIDRNKLIGQLTTEELATLIRAAIPPQPEPPKRLAVELQVVSFGSVMAFWLYSLPILAILSAVMAIGTCALGLGVAGLGGAK
jgi:hypothetical protein